MITPLQFKHSSPLEKRMGFFEDYLFLRIPLFLGVRFGIYIFQGLWLCGVKLPGFGIAACRKEAQR